MGQLMYNSEQNKLQHHSMHLDQKSDEQSAGTFWSYVPKQSLLRVLYYTPIAVAAFLFILILSYRFINPNLSTLMANELISGQRIKHKWVPISEISKHIPLAVILSEDNHYCDHYGVDWLAVKKVIMQGRTQRGASTITMQAVKNLFLWPNRSYLRKVIEVPMAYTVTMVWSKKRLMEIYLNIVEFGPGIYGVEAASRHFFKRKASQLSSRQSALLAAVLPNPKGRRAGRPGPKTRFIAGIIHKRMLHHKHNISCIF